MKNFNLLSLQEDMSKLNELDLSNDLPSVTNAFGSGIAVDKKAHIIVASLVICFMSADRTKASIERINFVQKLITKATQILKRIKDLIAQGKDPRQSDIDILEDIHKKLCTLESEARKFYRPNAQDKRFATMLNVVDAAREYEGSLRKCVEHLMSVYVDEFLEGLGRQAAEHDKRIIYRFLADIVAEQYECKIQEYYHPEGAITQGDFIDTKVLNALKVPYKDQNATNENSQLFYDIKIPDKILLQYREYFGSSKVFKYQELIPKAPFVLAEVQNFIDNLKSLTAPISEMHMPRYKYGVPVPIRNVFKLA